MASCWPWQCDPDDHAKSTKQTCSRKRPVGKEGSSILDDQPSILNCDVTNFPTWRIQAIVKYWAAKFPLQELQSVPAASGDVHGPWQIWRPSRSAGGTLVAAFVPLLPAFDILLFPRTPPKRNTPKSNKRHGQVWVGKEACWFLCTPQAFLYVLIVDGWYILMWCAFLRCPLLLASKATSADQALLNFEGRHIEGLEPALQSLQGHGFDLTGYAGKRVNPHQLAPFTGLTGFTAYSLSAL